MLRKVDAEKKLRSPHSNESYDLRKGLMNYKVLFDGSLSKKEKAEKLGVSEGIVRKEIKALKKYNILSPEEVEKYKSRLGL